MATVRRVVFLLAAALCCTALCVAETGAADLSRTTDNAKITLTRKFDVTNCTKSSTPATGKTSDVIISTKIALKKKGDSEKTPEIPIKPSEAVKVPDGYNLTLETSLDVKCTKEGTSAEIPGTTCTVQKGEAASDSITHDANVETTATGYGPNTIMEKKEHKVSLTAGYDVEIIANVVAKCSPLPVSDFSLSAEKNIYPTDGRGESPDPRDPDQRGQGLSLSGEESAGGRGAALGEVDADAPPGKQGKLPASGQITQPAAASSKQEGPESSTKTERLPEGSTRTFTATGTGTGAAQGLPSASANPSAGSRQPHLAPLTEGGGSVIEESTREGKRMVDKGATATESHGAPETVATQPPETEAQTIVAPAASASPDSDVTSSSSGGEAHAIRNADGVSGSASLSAPLMLTAVLMCRSVY
ncbi:hypothetical protein DQ04_12591010 [Trypanosoma grayi]|uniref:hypothetical protein n=1 Tax=Trypanosoma grayi TaxID=71804 RepID=UPI0004F49000|nr:hypothetical protein DQ04_12591010 [Trypanosoma grayi]KEG06717.1 hypothetical protein DQ04_12591010 [Trypanosoma grayi]